MRRSFLFALPLAAALLASSPAFAAGVSPAQATPAQREEATTHFTKGRDLFAANKFAEALAEFSASFEVVASPNTRLYIARCHRDLNHLTQAYAEFTRTSGEAKALAKDDPKYEKTAEAALDERKQMEPKLGFVDLAVTHHVPATVVKVAGDVVQRDAWSEPVAVMPGPVDVIVESPGKAPIVKSLQLAAGEHKPAEVDAGADAPPPPVVAQVEAPPPSKVPLRTYAYVAGGVAVAGLATFTIAGLMANGTYSDLEGACGSGPCPADRKDDISSGKTQQTVANIGLAVFVVGAAASVTLFVLSSKKTATPAASLANTRVVASPTFMGLQGAF